MVKRIVTGLLLLVVVLGVVFGLRVFSPIFADVIIVLFAFVGTYEMAKSLKKAGINVMPAAIITAVVTIYPLTYFLGTTGIFIAVALATIVAIGTITFKHGKTAVSNDTPLSSAQLQPCDSVSVENSTLDGDKSCLATAVDTSDSSQTMEQCSVASVDNSVVATRGKRKGVTYELHDLTATVFTAIYPLAIMMLLTVMNHSLGNLLGIVLVFAIVVLTDTMAYFVGVTCKGPKLCPKISPKKTISGAIGGLMGGVIGSIIVWLLFDKFHVFSYMGGNEISALIAGHTYLSLGLYIIIGLVCSMVAELGDLGASIIKRKLGIKDYGNIFPGHGGVMDRIDSFLFVTPVVYIILEIIFAITKAVM